MPENNGKKAGNRKGNNGGKGLPDVVEVRPIASPAQFKRRHYNLAISFVICVLVPVLLSAFYLFALAKDQYASSVGFTIRQEGSTSAGDIIGIATQLTGSSTQKDTDVLFEFLQNQNIVEKIDEEFDLAAHYSQFSSTDPFFALSEDATIEDKVDFWSRIASVLYDQASGLIEIQIVAFDRQTAHDIAQAVLRHSQDLINELNAIAREDRISYAEEDLDLAVDRLRIAREELVRFRTKNKIVDVTADLQSRLGVVSMLQQQLAEALIELDLLSLNTSPSDPRVIKAENTIKVIRSRLEAEKTNVISENEDSVSGAYPELLAEFESLMVNREYAEESYRAALAALDVARAEASRQSSYLAPFLKPTLAQASEYPNRWASLGLVLLFVMMSWTVITLIYYSIRDSR